MNENIDKDVKPCTLGIFEFLAAELGIKKYKDKEKIYFKAKRDFKRTLDIEGYLRLRKEVSLLEKILLNNDKDRISRF